jgi:TPR repeat protein
MYDDGWLVEKDTAESGKWYLKAAESFRKEAENDDPDAQWRLGLMYHSGQGVTKNEAEAQKWYLESG